LRFKSILNNFGLNQHCNFSTHQKGHTLDLVITRKNETILTPPYIAMEGLSDHHLIEFSLNSLIQTKVLKTITFRKLRNLDIDLLSTNISQRLKDSDNLEILCSNYMGSVAEAFNCVCPVIEKVITVRINAPWYNANVHKEKILRRRAERQWLNSKTDVNKQAYKDQLHIYNMALQKMKENYYEIRIKGNINNAKQLFILVNMLLSTKESKLPDSISDQQLSEDFASYFITKITNIRNGINQAAGTNTFQPKLHMHTVKKGLVRFKELGTPEIAAVIMNMSSATCELDPMQTSFVKECKYSLFPVIAKIVNLSIRLAYVPTILKNALINPLIKKPTLNCQIFKNFRPVSNLCFISKVVEKVMAVQLIEYIYSNQLQLKWQSAYKRAHSTETAILRVTNDILMAIDNKHCVILILLDLSAAFDTIDHVKLLHHLTIKYGISDLALKWFESYLTGRSQTVKINNTTSEKRNLECGVPQGSVLGPLLFTLYTSSLGELIEAWHNVSFICR